MNAEFAQRVWEILVKHVGAKENHTGERQAFIDELVAHWHTEDVEWRFCGSLGFGGKLYYNNNGLYVNCYVENLTRERQRAIKMANKELALLMDEVEMVLS